MVPWVVSVVLSAVLSVVSSTVGGICGQLLVLSVVAAVPCVLVVSAARSTAGGPAPAAL